MKLAEQLRTAGVFRRSLILIILFLEFAVALRVCADGGIPLWTNQYRGGGNLAYETASSIVADRDGNVFVTGSAFFINATFYDWATVAYSSGGTPLWTNIYGGPANGSDFPNTIAVSIDGKVFVTGVSYPPMFSGGVPDCATVAYSNSGVPLWTNRYNGPGNGAWARGLAVDSSGNVFVGCYSVGIGTGTDYTIIKYSNSGVPLWTNRYNGPGNNNDYSAPLVVDGSDNLIVTGRSFGNGTDYDYTTIKYSNAGVPQWTNRYIGPGNDSAQAVAVDSSGNVVVTGSSSTLASGSDYVTIRYSAAGIPLWTNRYNGPANSNDVPQKIVINDNGDIFITGNSLGTGLDLATVAYSSTGMPLWTNRYNGPENGDEGGHLLALDKDSNVFVTGFPFNAGDYMTLAYSSTGAPLWTNRYAHFDDFGGGPFGMTTDSDGNVFVTGGVSDVANSFGWVTIKYSSSLRPRLSAQKLNNRIVLTWPTNVGAFTLQSATNLNSSIFWNNSTNMPVAIGTTFTVTNATPAAAQFFRLIKP